MLCLRLWVCFSLDCLQVPWCPRPVAEVLWVVRRLLGFQRGVPRLAYELGSSYWPYWWCWRSPSLKHLCKAVKINDKCKPKRGCLHRQCGTEEFSSTFCLKIFQAKQVQKERF